MYTKTGRHLTCISQAKGTNDEPDCWHVTAELQLEVDKPLLTQHKLLPGMDEPDFWHTKAKLLM